MVHQLTKHITVSEDAFYEYTKHYLDTGQFGEVPIFAPFNYKHGYIWGTETAVTYNAENLSIHASTTIGRNMQKGVATGQFNFDPDELGYINRHYIVLDHQPLYGASGGITYRLETIRCSALMLSIAVGCAEALPIWNRCRTWSRSI